MIIGISGKLGSGKTFISKLLTKERKDSLIINVDENNNVEKTINNNRLKLIIIEGKDISYYSDMCNTKILVEAPYEERLNRIMKRDNITKEEFDKMDSIEYDITDFDYYLINTKKNGIKKIVKTIYYNL